MPKRALEPLPDFCQLSDRVWRVMGLNPGFFTLQGTNTYLVGKGPRKILIDCGQGELGYWPLIHQSLASISPDAYISDLLLTHGHYDHWGGLIDIDTAAIWKNNAAAVEDDDQAAAEQVSPIKVHKYPFPPGSRDEAQFMHGFPAGIHLHNLQDNQVFHIDSDTTLRVVFTGGHGKDHCAFWLEEEQSLFTGDCVLGHGTVVFDDLNEYLQGLHRLEGLRPRRLYPGHGAVVENGVARIKQYLEYRYQREHEILNLIKSDQSRPWTSLEIGERLIREDLTDDAQPAFLRGIALHLQKLERDGVVRLRNTGSDDDDEENFDSLDVVKMVNKEWLYIGKSQL